MKPRLPKATLGLLASGTTATALSLTLGTLYVAIANSLAEDGPYFAPPLIALFFIALPLAMAFLPFQIIALGYYLLRARLLLVPSLLLGGVGGILAGAFLGLVIFSAEAIGLLLFAGIGLVHGIAALGCYSLFVTWAFRRRLDSSDC